MGEALSADARIKLKLTVGDPSTSNSEQWALRVGAIRHVAPTHGSVVTTAYAFDVGKSYPISLEHLSTRLDTPDYDWSANIEKTDRPEFFVVDENKPFYIIGPYQGGWMSWAVANYASLEAQLHIPALDVDVDSNNDSRIDPDNSPSGTDDPIEHEASTGKLVGVGAADRVPLEVRLSANVAEARPTSTEVYFDYDPTVFTLWKNAGPDRSPGNMIPAKTWVNANAIALAPGGSQTVYVEALKGTSGAVPITTSVKV